MKIPILYVSVVRVQCMYVFGIKSGYFFLFLFYFIVKMHLISTNLQNTGDDLGILNRLRAPQLSVNIWVNIL